MKKNINIYYFEHSDRNKLKYIFDQFNNEFNLNIIFQFIRITNKTEIKLDKKNNSIKILYGSIDNNFNNMFDIVIFHANLQLKNITNYKYLIYCVKKSINIKNIFIYNVFLNNKNNKILKKKNNTYFINFDLILNVITLLNNLDFINKNFITKQFTNVKRYSEPYVNYLFLFLFKVISLKIKDIKSSNNTFYIALTHDVDAINKTFNVYFKRIIGELLSIIKNNCEYYINRREYNKRLFNLIFSKQDYFTFEKIINLEKKIQFFFNFHVIFFNRSKKIL